MKRIIFAAISIAYLALTSLPAESSFPRKPITMIVSYGAGAASDTICRVLSSVMERYGGKSVNVINKTGGGGMSGLQTLYNSRPEGYVVGHIYPDYVLIKKILNPESVNFDVMQFTWLAEIGASPFVLVVGRDSSYKDLKRLREADSLTWGIERPGSSEWAASVIASEKIGLRQKFVFGLKSDSIIAALVERKVDIAVFDVNHPLVKHNIERGTIKPILSFGESHIQFIEDVPTATERGFDIILEKVQALVAPPGVPSERIEDLERLIQRALDDNEYQRFLRDKNPGLRKGNKNSKETKQLVKNYYNLFHEYKELLRSKMQ